MKYPLFTNLFFFFLLTLIPGLVGHRNKLRMTELTRHLLPIANWWGAFILHDFPGTSIPTIIILLVGGAIFFTIYFGFVNVRRFPLAIQTVRGKYDEVDHHEAGEKYLAI